MSEPTTEVQWDEIAEDFQCDTLCRPDIHRVPGMGVVCGGCDACVVLISEGHAQEIELEREIVREVNHE